MTKEEVDKRAEELAEEHWNYIHNLLLSHEISAHDIEIASFHYWEAFKHGYKHCWEDLYSENAGKIVFIDPKGHMK